jgi:hypothetical protein
VNLTFTFTWDQLSSTGITSEVNEDQDFLYEDKDF